MRNQERRTDHVSFKEDVAWTILNRFFVGAANTLLHILSISSIYNQGIQLS